MQLTKNFKNIRPVTDYESWFIIILVIGQDSVLELIITIIISDLKSMINH